MKTKISKIFITGLLATSFAFAQENTQKVDLKKFRFSYEKMYDTANPNNLKHRIFYEKPSEGEHSAWFDAVKQGNTKLVKKMLKENPNLLEVKDEKALGQTALGWACFIGYFDLVKFFIEKKGANIYATDRADVFHILKSTVLGGDIKVLKYVYPIFEGKVDINYVEPDGETLLMVAATDGRTEATKFYLDKGADVNIYNDQFKWNSLTAACKKGHKEIVEMLIKAGATNHVTNKPECGDFKPENK